MIWLVDDKNLISPVKALLDIYGVYGETDEVLENSAESEIISRDTHFISIFKKADKTVIKVRKSDAVLEEKTFESLYSDSRILSVLRAIYDFLGEEVPSFRKSYGLLTGIRPVKLFNYLAKLCGEEAAQKIFKEKYLVSDEKTAFIKTVHDIQLRYLDSFQGTYGIYINIPFCPGRCSYCSFYSEELEKSRKWLEPYVDALCRELETKKAYLGDKPVTAVYVGGGTPGVLEEPHINKLFDCLYQSVDIEKLLEISFEMGRADTFTREKLILLKAYGVNRISVNPQSLNEQTLRRIGRKGTLREFEAAYYMAQEFGFDINTDMINGLEGESLTDMLHTLEGLISMRPEAITVHTLAVKRGSKLIQTFDGSKFAPGYYAKAQSVLNQELAANGYRPYYMYRQKHSLDNGENIGYCQNGKASIYNMGMMDSLQNIIGIGAGSSSKLLTNSKISKRLQNPKDIRGYINSMNSKQEIL